MLTLIFWWRCSKYYTIICFGILFDDDKQCSSINIAGYLILCVVKLFWQVLINLFLWFVMTGEFYHHFLMHIATQFHCIFNNRIQQRDDEHRNSHTEGKRQLSVSRTVNTWLQKLSAQTADLSKYQFFAFTFMRWIAIVANHSTLLVGKKNREKISKRQHN